MPSSNVQQNNKYISTPFSKHQYRTSLGITCDILQACMEAGIDGISVFKISQKANLSHSTVVDNCQRLTNVGIVKTNRIKRKYIFTITEKGIKFFYELEKFQDTIKEINIRY